MHSNHLLVLSIFIENSKTLLREQCQCFHKSTNNKLEVLIMKSSHEWTRTIHHSQSTLIISFSQQMWSLRKYDDQPNKKSVGSRAGIPMQTGALQMPKWMLHFIYKTNNLNPNIFVHETIIPPSTIDLRRSCVMNWDCASH